MHILATVQRSLLSIVPKIQLNCEGFVGRSRKMSMLSSIEVRLLDGAGSPLVPLT